MELIEVGPGTARLTMEVKEHMLNFHGAANGGVIFSLADAAFAVASNSHGQTAVGLNMNITYMAPGFTGDRLTAVATEEKKSNRIGLYRIEILNQKEELVALAEGVVYRKKEFFANAD
ncbi:MAG: hydroxyphenylacetyl-CoA thioesterase PaaI [Bacillaceae bacterium]|nr:hydroxyphenylacetyl-CoA thioesterase PaaI [Bacillaceae bacterium]